MVVRLEDEAQELRRRARASEERRAGSGALVEATVLRQRRALEAASDAVRLHRSVFENAADGLALLEAGSLRILEANAALRALTGRDADELSGLAVLDLFGGGDVRPARADLESAARDRSPVPASLVRRGGRVVPVEIAVTIAGEGVEARLLATFHDLSDRKLAEAAREDEVRSLNDRIVRLEQAHGDAESRCADLDQANRCLAELSERKDLYLSSVSHELRTPLASIRSFSEILIKHGDAEVAVRREFLGIIQKESERLTRLVNDVLDLARIEAGAAKLFRTEFDARGVLLDAVASVRGLAADGKVQVEPKTGGAPLTLRADRDRIQQLLVNLLGNAIKFSPADSVVDVEVAFGETPDRVHFTVRDRGRGISPEHLDRVFDRFHRTEDDPAIAGTGLGLSICREIAAMHGGRIWAESVVGEGSVFHAEIPAWVEPASRGPRTESPITANLGRISAMSVSDITREITREVTREITRELTREANRFDVAAARAGAAVADLSSTTGSLPPYRRK
jgi:PAS domain S-box-containing protein